jgi:hypothetical protein
LSKKEARILSNQFYLKADNYTKRGKVCIGSSSMVLRIPRGKSE